MSVDGLNRQASNTCSKRLKEARFPLKAIICRCLIKKQNLLSIGHGVSQTHLLISLGINPIENGYLVRFLPIYDFLEKLALDQSTGHKTEFIKEVIAVDSTYYTAPDYLISKNVTVHSNASSIYHNDKLLVTYSKTYSGVFQKSPRLVPLTKTMIEEDYLKSLFILCKEIGPQHHTWTEKVCNNRCQLGLRTLSCNQSEKNPQPSHSRSLLHSPLQRRINLPT